MATAVTALTGGIPLVDLNKCSAVPVGLVSHLSDQFAPVGITDRFGQFRVLDHVLHTQRLAANHLVFVYQLCGELVGKVAAAVSLSPS